MTKQESKSQIEGIISLCRAVSEGAIDPFDIDTDYVLSVIRRYYPDINTFEEFCLDATALKELSSVLERQNEWIHHQSTTLYKDPFMLSQQLLMMDVSAIADALLKSWHPIVEFGQISPKTIVNSLAYWGDLIPLDERWNDLQVEVTEMGTATMKDVRDLGYIPEEGFTDTMETYWREMKKKAGEDGTISYWDWIGADSYRETLRRAFITSYLVGYGYAVIQMDRFGENVVLYPLENPVLDMNKEKISLPVLVDREEWERWRNE